MTGEDKLDRNKFALAFLAASGSILYMIYNNIQNAPIDIESYFIICLIFAGAFISIIGFLAYLLIKVYLIEAQDIVSIDFINKLTSWLYRCSLLFFAVLAFFIAVLFFDFNVPPEIKEPGKIIITVMFGVCLFILVLISIYQYFINRSLTGTILLKDLSLTKSDLLGSILVGFIFIIWIFLSLCFVCYTPLHGHVEVDMESIHYKNDTQIPVLIQVTGPNTDLYVLLYKELPGKVKVSNISYIGPIEPNLLDIESDLEERKIESNNLLLGSYLGNGKYSVFINTTNLTTGYYELMCLRKFFYEKTCESKSFYLLNGSQQSHIR